MAFPAVHPQPLVRVPRAFNDPDWVWELKLDGFRALAYVERHEVRLVSRHGHVYRSFEHLRVALGAELQVKNAILDAEIVCLDEAGRSLFTPLLFHRQHPVLAVFDLLWLNGEDLRELPLVERKWRLRPLLPVPSAHLLYVDAVAEKGIELFELACQEDLEGVVGKWAPGTYQRDGRSTSWVKVKNVNYSQAEGREELFEARGSGRPTPSTAARPDLTGGADRFLVSAHADGTCVRCQRGRSW